MARHVRVDEGIGAAQMARAAEWLDYPEADQAALDVQRLIHLHGWDANTGFVAKEFIYVMEHVVIKKYTGAKMRPGNPYMRWGWINEW